MTAPAESIGGSQQQTTARSKTNSKLPVRTTPVPSYQQYLGQELRARYLELQCEYELAEAEPSEPSRQAVTDVLNKRIKALLAEVSHMLCTQPDAYTIGSHLDLVEKLLVFVCPVPMLEAHAEILLSGLKTSAIENRAELEKGITQWLNPLSNTHDKQVHDDQHHDAQHHLRIALAEVVSASNRAHCQIIMNSNMQIQRLTGLRNWGIAITICFLLLSPLAINVEALLQLNTPTEYMLGTTVHMTGTPPQLIGDRWELAAIAWGQALAILLIGAISGFLSGLLQARHSQISIRGYRENRLKIQLKPLVGALVALLLYIFLSWNTIPGIKVDSTGSYLLLAFLAGFSERYFLQLFNLKNDEEKPMENMARNTGQSHHQTRDRKVNGI